jgi:deazaflavin-dependent oxidoreductase (nitroreductase family)
MPQEFDHEEAIIDSPSGWVRDHIHRYIETDGHDGHLWRGCPTLLLTTRGRKSGYLRRTALIYGRDGANYLIVASKGGAPEHPNHLVVNPEVEIQVKDQHIHVRARTASDEEKPRLWKIVTEVYPPYDEYQAKTERVIPLVILEPLP